MRTRHTPPSWPLRLFLVAGLLATSLTPGRASAAPGAAAMGAGAVGRGVDNGAHAPRGPAAGWERGVRARYAILVDPATGAVLWGAGAARPCRRPA
jgi:hypothetical protein